MLLILLIAVEAKMASQALLLWIGPEHELLILFSKTYQQVMGPVSAIIDPALALGVLLVVMYSILTRVSESGKLDFITDLRSFLPATPQRDRHLKPLTGDALVTFTRLLKNIVRAIRLINVGMAFPF